MGHRLPFKIQSLLNCNDDFYIKRRITNSYRTTKEANKQCDLEKWKLSWTDQTSWFQNIL
jgi:hypothetical protein